MKANRMTPATRHRGTVPPGNNLPSTSRYRLVRMVRRSHVSSVYLGVFEGQHGFTRRVAIRRVHPEFVHHREVRSAMLAEARLGVRTAHPNVLRIEDVEATDEELILVMSFVDGATVAEMSAVKRRFPVAVATRIAVDACIGMSAIHAAKEREDWSAVARRHIAPRNVLVGLDGITRIADGCIAPGPPRRDGGVRGDVHALGAMLRNMLGGATDDHARGLPALVGVDFAVSRAIDEVVSRALARSPEARFASTKELAVALARAAGERLASPAEVGSFVTSVGPRCAGSVGFLDETPVYDVSDEEIEVVDAA